MEVILKHTVAHLYVNMTVVTWR